MDRYEGILRFMPRGSLYPILTKGLEECPFPAEEIRIRAGRPLSLFAGGNIYFVHSGGISREPHDGYIVSRSIINALFKSICENSVYAYIDEIRQGFVTIKGGHRVGFTGRAICSKDNKIESFRDISSVNIRIAREFLGSAEPIIGNIINGGAVRSTLIISPPGVGKTTVLRDIARLVSNRGIKVGIADDRGEIAAMFKGVPSNDVGVNTDVIEYAPKGDGISILLRTMSPGVIITDELVTEREIFAVCCAKGSGSAIIASVHGSTFDELNQKPVFKPLLNNHVFERLILLKGRSRETNRLETEIREI